MFKKCFTFSGILCDRAIVFNTTFNNISVKISWRSVFFVEETGENYRPVASHWQSSYWTKGSPWLSWSHHFESFKVATITWLTVMDYLCDKWPRCFSLVVSTSRSSTHSWLITGFVTRLTRRVPLVEQELLTLPEHLRSPPVLSGVRITRYLVLFVYFIFRCLSFCTFSFGHCVVCPSSIYGFWLPLWYLQTLLIT